MNVLVDTNILVDALRGIPEAHDYLMSCGNDSIYCSVITIAELWAGARPSEKEALETFLSGFQSIPIDERTAHQAGEYMQRFAKGHGMLLPDALIAASVHSVKAALATRNTKHFPMKDIEIVNPY